MKIDFFGDSITDAFRNREATNTNDRFGCGFVAQLAAKLFAQNPLGYEIKNAGIGGNRIVDLYARIKTDVWNFEPDVLNILVGINDVWHEFAVGNGVDVKRWERMYREIIEDTRERLPNVKIIICEPFVGHGFITNDEYEKFLEIREYAAAAKKLAEEYGLYFLPLQEKISSAEEKYGEGVVLVDGVHPTLFGASIIAEEWWKLFNGKILL